VYPSSLLDAPPRQDDERSKETEEKEVSILAVVGKIIGVTFGIGILAVIAFTIFFAWACLQYMGFGRI